MKGLLAFMIMMILSANCQFVDRETARSQVKEIASMLSHPPGSVVILTADELLPKGNSETCTASDKRFLIGSSQSRGDIADHYDRQLGSGWSKSMGTDFIRWSKVNGRFGQTVGIDWQDSFMGYLPSYDEAVFAARSQYSTTYVLLIISLTADTCKGG